MLTASEGTVRDAENGALGITPGIALAVLTATLLVLGVYPGPFWNAISAATLAQH